MNRGDLVRLSQDELLKFEAAEVSTFWAMRPATPKERSMPHPRGRPWVRINLPVGGTWMVEEARAPPLSELPWGKRTPLALLLDLKSGSHFYVPLSWISPLQ